MKKFLVVLLVAAFVPLTAAAAPGKKVKKPKKAELLAPLQDEMEAQGELHKLVTRSIRDADRCMLDDKRWNQALEDALPVNSIYEMLQGQVFCWQDAEKRAKKGGAPNEPALAFMAARARYVEAYRTYIWGIEAKLLGDRINTCTRMTSAVKEASAAEDAAAGLAEKFSTPEGQALGKYQTDQTGFLVNMVGDEYARQKCD